MSISDAIGLTALLFVVIGAAAGLFIFFRLAPFVNVRVLPKWTGKADHLLLLRFEIENKSRVRISLPRARAQILKHAIGPNVCMSEWVPFVEKDIRKDEQPLEWHDPVPVFETTERIYPGEVVSVERLYHFPEDEVILHIGLQVELVLNLLGRMQYGTRRPFKQTATCFAAK